MNTIIKSTLILWLPFAAIMLIGSELDLDESCKTIGGGLAIFAVCFGVLYVVPRVRGSEERANRLRFYDRMEDAELGVETGDDGKWFYPVWKNKAESRWRRFAYCDVDGYGPMDHKFLSYSEAKEFITIIHNGRTGTQELQNVEAMA